MARFIIASISLALFISLCGVSNATVADISGLDYYHNASLLYGRQLPEEPEQPVIRDITNAGARFPRCRDPCSPNSCSGRTSCPAALRKRGAVNSNLITSLPWTDENYQPKWRAWLSKRFWRINLQNRYLPPVRLDQDGNPVLDDNGNQISLYTPAQIARFLRNMIGSGEDGSGPNENWNNEYGSIEQLAVNGDDGELNERPVGRQREFGTAAFQIGSGYLHGCTVVTIVSRRAVWMAHFWEEYSHGTVEYDEDTIDEEQIQAQQDDLPAFRERILDFIRGVTPSDPATNSHDYEADEENPDAPGELVGGYLDPAGVSPTQGLYNQPGDDTQAFIMTPTRDNEATGSGALYGSRNEELVQLLEQRFNARVTTYSYRALDYNGIDFSGPDGEIAGTDERGNALFQFDPDSDKQGGRAWRLFLEAAVSSGSVADAE
ncbi:hypothetical protein Slin15195_G000670 [Septoria linicola]|uniref:Uncharacterized protein n=1 Tax=Septoria linicola TaxID=215465 RepID=A0A9Q9AH41_9PEZI|nr:hypothetical protein Slin15195_G000670 [Septoria linicola]